MTQIQLLPWIHNIGTQEHEDIIKHIQTLTPGTIIATEGSQKEYEAFQKVIDTLAGKKLNQKTTEFRILQKAQRQNGRLTIKQKDKTITLPYYYEILDFARKLADPKSRRTPNLRGKEQGINMPALLAQCELILTCQQKGITIIPISSSTIETQMMTGEAKAYEQTIEKGKKIPIQERTEQKLQKILDEYNEKITQLEQKREQAFTENLLSIIRLNPDKKIVTLTGAHHTKEIEKRLKTKGIQTQINYMIFNPLSRPEIQETVEKKPENIPWRVRKNEHGEGIFTRELFQMIRQKALQQRQKQRKRLTKTRQTPKSSKFPKRDQIRK